MKHFANVFKKTLFQLFITSFVLFVSVSQVTAQDYTTGPELTGTGIGALGSGTAITLGTGDSQITIDEFPDLGAKNGTYCSASDKWYFVKIESGDIGRISLPAGSSYAISKIELDMSNNSSSAGSAKGQWASSDDPTDAAADYTYGAKYDVAGYNACGAVTITPPTGTRSVIFGRGAMGGQGTTGGEHWLFAVRVWLTSVSGPELNIQESATDFACGSTYDFGTVATNATGSTTFTIQNTGTDVLTISSITPSGDYSITNTPSLSIAAGGSTTIDVEFAPTATGTRTGTIVIVSDDSDEGSCTINLTGEGTTPACAAGTPAIVATSAQCGGTINLTANGSAAVGDAWYWQTSATGESTTYPSTSTYPVTTSGTYYLRAYNASGSCWGTAALETVTISTAPTAEAGSAISFTQNATSDASTTLAADAPTAPATGAWTIVSGGTGTFSDATSPTSTFTPTAGSYPASYILRWTVSNSPCSDATDDVTVDVAAYVAGTSCEIDGFSIYGIDATISGNNINLTLPAGVDLASLSPTITTLDGAVPSPASGVATDFSCGAVTYTSTNGANVCTYTVNVTNSATTASSSHQIAWTTDEGLTVTSDKAAAFAAAGVTYATNSGVAITASSLNAGNTVGNYWEFTSNSVITSVRLYGKIQDANMLYQFGGQVAVALVSTNTGGNAEYILTPTSPTNKLRLEVNGTSGYWFRNITFNFKTCNDPVSKIVTGDQNIFAYQSSDVTLASAQCGVSYELYANGTLVSGSAQTGTGADLTWTVAPSATTTYTVKSTTANGYCEAAMSDDAVKTVIACTDETRTISGTAYITSGGSTTLTLGGTQSGFTVQWYKDSVAISGATAFTYNANSVGEYYAIVHGACYQNSNSITVTMPIITTANSAKTFAACLSGTDTETISVTGTDLVNPVTLVLSGAGAAQYSLSTSSVTAATANGAGQSVTITYTGTATAATHAAVLTLSSTGAADVVINLSGTTAACYTLSTSVSPAGGGTVTASPNQATYVSGTSVTLTANPNPGYQFYQWTGDLTSTNASETITMNADKSVTAIFVEAVAGSASCYSEDFESVAPSGFQTCASNATNPLGVYYTSGSSTTKCSGLTVTTANGDWGGSSSEFAASGYIVNGGSQSIYVARDGVFNFPTAANAKKLSFYIYAKSPSNSDGKGFKLLINGTAVTNGVLANGIALVADGSNYSTAFYESDTKYIHTGSSWVLIEYDLTAYPSATIALETADNSNSEYFLDNASVTCAPELNVKVDGSDVACGNTVDYGDLTLGSTLEKTFSVQNVGGEDMTISSLSVSPTTDFSIVSVVPSTIGASSVAAVTVRFSPSSFGTKTATMTIVNDDNTDNVDETNCPIILTGVGLPTVPALEALPTPITGLDYLINTGPSATESITVKGWNLTNGDIAVSGLSNFEVSFDGGSTWVTSTTYTSGSTDPEFPVLVRLSSGLSSGTYSETITFTATTDGISQTVTVSGEVTLPAPELSVAPDLSGMTYVVDYGPSAQLKTFAITKANLLPGQIVIDASSTNFEISIDDATWTTSLSLDQFEDLSSIYVRLKGGLSVGTYADSIIVYGGGIDVADAVKLSVQGEVLSTLADVYEITTDQPGDKTCQGEPVQLTVDLTSGSSYLWESRPSGSSGAWTTIGQTTQTITVNPYEDTQYRVTVDGVSVLKSVRAVICCSALTDQKIVFTDDFETLASETARTSNSYITSSYSYASSGEISDGKYAVVANAYNSSNTYWRDMPDHTSGDTYGGMLAINGSAAGQVAYRRTYTGMCENTIYDFSAFIANIHKSTTTNLPNLTFKIKSADGSTTFDEVNTGDIPFGGAWYERGISFNSGANSDIMLEIVSNKEDGGGNDFAIDDITFKTCAPNPLVYSSVPNEITDTTVCEDAPLELTAYTYYDITTFYPTPWYQWQYSDNGTNWFEFGSPIDGSNTYTVAIDTVPEQPRYYRCVVGPTSSVVTAVSDSLLDNTGSTAANLSSCETFGLTNTTIITKNPPITMGDTVFVSACIGETVSLTGTTDASYWSFGENTFVDLQARSGVSSKTISYPITGAGYVYFYGWADDDDAACRADQVFQIDIVPPTPPTVTDTSTCAMAGTITWSDLVTKTDAGSTLKWYIDNSPATTALASEPAAQTTANPGAFYYFVSELTPEGCETTRVPVLIEVTAPVDLPTVSDSIVCMSAPTLDYNASTNVLGASLRWYDDDVTTTYTTTTPTQATTTAGTFTKYVSQVSGACVSDRVAVSISVEQAATLTLDGASGAATQTICAGDAIDDIIYNIGGGATTAVVSSMPSGLYSSTVAGVLTIAGTPADSGSFTITANAGCAPAIETVTINVNPIPAAITGTLTVCQGLTTTLASTTAGGTWSSSNTAVATVNASGVVTGVSAGTSTITYTVSGCSVTADVTVNANPVIELSVPASAICPSSTTALTTSLTTATVATYTYLWTNASATTAGSADFTASALCTDSKNVTVQVTDGNGCIASDTKSVSSGDTTAPTVTGTLTSTIEGCDASSAPAAATTAAELVTLGATISDNCTANADLAVTYSDASSGTCPLTITRTYTVKDACLNSTTIDHVITIDDTTAPTVTGTLTSTIEGCDASSAPAAATTAAELVTLGATISDNCTANADLAVTYSDASSGTCPLTITRTYTVKDACLNGTTIDHVITIDDTTAPTVTGTLTSTIEGCDASSAPAAATTAAELVTLGATISDNCTANADLAVAYSDASSGTCPLTITRTYTVKDACLNSTTIDHVITIDDTTAPTVTGTLTSTIEGCDASSAPAAATTAAELVTLGATISDNCTANADLAVTYSDASSGTCPLTITRTYTVKDACLNSTTIDHVITIDDTTAPTVTGTLTSTIEGCDASSAPAAATTAAELVTLGATISDNCTANADLAVTYSDASSGTCPLTITRTYTVKDACLNSTTIDHVITIDDTTAPTVTGTLTSTIEGCDASSAPAAATTAAELVTLGATISDNCTANADLAVTYSDASSGTCPLTITRTYTVKDACLNSTTIDHVITIDDTTAPTVTGTLTSTIEGCDASSAPAAATTAAELVTLGATISDNCTANADLAVTYSDASSGTCPLTITRTYTVKDACLNSTTIDHVITIDDTTAPTVTGTLTSTIEGCDASSAPAAATTAAELVTLGATISDNCTANADLAVTYSDASSGTCPLTITRTYTVKDACLNSTTIDHVITIDDTTAPTVTGTLTSTIEGCDASSAPAAATTAAELVTLGATISDNCTANADLAVTYSDASSGTCPLTITRTYTVKDACLNSTTIDHVITIDDTTAPTVTGTLTSTIEGCDASSAPAAATTAAELVTLGATISDNCTANADLAVTYSDASSGTCPLTITRTYTVKDACLNSTTIDHVITIDDTTAPTVTGTLTSTIEGCDASSAPAAATTAAELVTLGATISDNCTANADLAVTYSDASSGTCPLTITRTYTVKDACLNSTTIDHVITIDDTTAPTVTGTLTSTIEGCDASSAPAAATTAAELVTLGATISDNCTANADLAVTYSDASSGTCPLTITRTYTVKDACLNSTTIDHVITIDDTTAPTVTGTLTTQTVEGCDISAAPAAVTTVAALEAMGIGVLDVCSADGDITVSSADGSASGTCPISFTRTYRIADACGNSTDVTQAITIDDTTAPTGSSPAPITVQCSGDVPAADITVITDEADNCTAVPTVTHVGDVSDGNSCPEIITRTYRIGDECGNTTDVTQTITIEDTTDPVITGSLADQAATSMGSCTFQVPDVTGLVRTISSDNCTANGALVITQSPAAGSVIASSTSVTVTVADACGNDATTPVNITVPSAPTIVESVAPSCSVDLLTYSLKVAVSSGGTVTSTSGTVADEGSDVWSISSIATGTNITATVTAADGCTADLNITAPDCSCGVIAAPVSGGNKTYCAGGTVPSLSASVGSGFEIDWYDAATGGNLLLSNSTTYSPSAGTATYYAEARESATGCVSSRTAISVTENINPVIELTVPSSSICPGSTASLSTSLTTSTVGAYTYTWTNAVASTAGNADYTAGVSCNATVAVTVEVEDGNGCLASDTKNILSKDDVNPTGTAPAAVSVQCSVDVPAVDITAITDEADNCTAVPTVSHVGDVSDGNSCPEVITRTYRIADACGNSIDVTQAITIDDTTAPTGSSPAPITVQCSGDVPAADITVITDEADNCTAVPTVTHVGDVSDGNSCPEVITRTYRIGDECGNTTDVTQTITIEDTTDPVITGSVADQAATSMGSCTFQVPDVTGLVRTISSDNCTANGALVITQSPAAGSVIASSTSVTVTVADACGNDATTPVNITVPSAPTIVESVAPSCSVDLLTYSLKVAVSSGGTVTSTSGTVADEGSDVWSISSIATGTNITATVTAADGCTADLNITAPDCSCGVIAAPVSGGNKTYCAGGTVPSLSASVGSGFEIDWYDAATGGNLLLSNSTTYSPSAGTATYYAEARESATGCVSSRTAISVTENINPVIELTVPSSSICPGSTASLSTSLTTSTVGAYTYTWTNAVASTAGNADYTAGVSCNATVAVTVEVEDGNGCLASDTKNILSKDDVNPTGTAPAAVSVQCSVDVPAVDITAITDEADNCTAVPTVSHVGDVSDGNSCPEVITRTYRIADACGNSIDVTQAITIDDTTAPTGSSPAPITVQCSGDVPAADITVITDEADNCTAVPTVTHVGDVSDGNSCPEVITRTYRIGDECGNTTDVTQTITIEDTTDPVITGSVADQAATSMGSCTFQVPDVTGLVRTISSDNCTANGALVITQSPAAGSVIASSTSVTVTVADACGNDATTPVNITVPSAPTIVESVAPSCSVDLLTYSLKVAVSSGGTVTSTSGTVADEGSDVWSISSIATGTNITATVTAADGCTADLNITAPDCSCGVIAAPVSGGNKTYCAGGTVPSLSASVGSGFEIDWYDAATGGNLLLSNSTTYSPSAGTATYYAEARESATGCVSSRTAISVTENINPVIELTVPSSSICPGSTASLSTSLTTSTVGAYTYTWTNAVASTAGNADYTAGVSCNATVAVTVEVEDGNGCLASDTKNILSKDDVNPTGTAPAAVSVQCSVDVPAVDITAITDEADNCTAVPTVSHVGDVSDGNSCPEVITRTYRIADACGNSIDVTQAITIDDTTAPTGSSPAPITVQCSGDVPAADITVITDEADNCTAVPTVTHVGDVSDGNSCPEVITRTYRIGDECGNTTDVTQTITIEDTTDPVITGSVADQAATSMGSCTFQVPDVTGLVRTISSDNCTANGALVITQSPAAGSVIASSTSVTVTVADACGNDATTPVNITVPSAPTIVESVAPSCSVDLLTYSLKVAVSSGGTVTSTSGTVADEGSDVWSISSIATGTNITATVTAADGCTADLNITAPDCSCGVIAAPVSGGNKTYCAGGTVPSLSASVGSGFEIDWYDAATGGNLLLSNSTTYSPSAGTATYYAEARESATGCVSSRTAISVTENINPVIELTVPSSSICPGSTASLSTSLTTSTVGAYTYTWTNAVASTAGNADYTAGVSCNATVAVTVEVEDGNGCLASDTKNILSKDDVNPTGTAPAAVSVQCSVDVPAVDITAITDEADNCTAVPTVSHVGDVSDGNSCPEVITRTYRIADACGNSIDVTQAITIDDTTAPTGSSPAPITVQCSGDVPAADITVITDEADNCTAVPTVTHVGDVSDGNSCPEVITRTYRIGDECGNTTDVTQTITIEDTTDPVITGSVADQAATSMGSCTFQVPDVTGLVRTISSDNCTANGALVITQSPAAGSVIASSTSVTVTVADACGNDATTPVNITVPSAPTIVESVAPSCSVDLLTYSLKVAVSSGGTVTSTSGTVADEGSDVWSISSIATGTNITATVTAADGCTADLNITAPDCSCPSIDAPVAGNITVCYDGAVHTGSATVNADEVVDWYDASTGGVSTTVPSGTTAGTYTAYAEARNTTTNCISAARTLVTVVINPLPIASISGTTSVCKDAASPDVTFTGANGTAPYTFTYTLNGTTQTVTTTSGNSVTVSQATGTAGSYVYELVSVQDASSTACVQSQTGSATITVNPLPSASISGTTAVCKDAASPDVTFTGANGTAPYTFTYTLNGTTQTVTTTSGNSVTVSQATGTAGSYVYELVSVQDASSTACVQSQTGSATITVNPLPIASISGTTSVCKDAASPDVTFTGANGTAPYTFTYTLNGTTQTVTTTSGNSVTVSQATGTAGSYVYELVSVQDASSTACVQSQTGSATITVNPLPSASISGTTAVCKDAASPDVTFTGANGTAPYTFTYTLNGTTQTVTTTSGNSVTVSQATGTAGSYVYELVSVQDASSTACVQSQTGSATITVNPLPTASISGTAAVCKDAAAPDVTFTGANGTAPYTFTYTLNGTTQTVTTTSGNSVTVSQATGTAGSYVYELVSVQDASSTACVQSQTGSATITVNPLPSASISGTTSVCKDAAAPDITFTGANGTAPYTFTYTLNGTTQTVTTTSGNSVTVSQATGTAGIYVYELVSVQDASSTACVQSQTGSATITVNPLPSASISGTTSVCKDAASPDVTFTGANGTAPYTFTYTLNGTTQTVTTTSGNSVTVSQATGTAGSYVYELVSVQDASSTACVQSQTGSATITVNPLPSASISGTTAVCKDAASPDVTFTGANGTAPYTFTYTLNGTTQTVTTTSGNSVTVSQATGTAGSYVYELVSVQDASSTACVQSQTGSATITVNPLPSASISGTTSVCKDAASPDVTFTGANGTAPYTFTYTLNGTTQTVTTTSGNSVTVSQATGTAGSYVYELVSVQDASSTACVQSQTGSATITVNPLPTASISGTAAVCKDAAALDVTFTGANGTAPYTFTYTLNGTTQTVTTTSGNSVTVSQATGTAGSYVYELVSVQDASSTACVQSQTGSATITVNPLPSASISGTTSVCKYAAAPDITFTGANGTAPYTFTYTLNGTTQTVTTTSGNSVTVSQATGTAGSYVYELVSVQDASSTACVQSQTGSATITVNPLPSASISGNATICQYVTTSPEVTFTGADGTAPYTFTYTVNSGVAQTVTTISGNSVTVSQPTNIAGDYVYELVSVKDASSTACEQVQSGTVKVTVNPKPTIVITKPDSVCFPSTVDITAANVTVGSTAGLAYSYYSDASATTALTDPTSVPTTGTYYIVGVTSALCYDTAAVSVMVNAKPELTLNASPSPVCRPDVVDITTGTSSSIAGSISYYRDANLSEIYSKATAVDTSGTYFVLVETAFGCRDTDNVIVTVNEPATLVLTSADTTQSQSVCSQGDTIVNIVYTYGGGATGATVTKLDGTPLPAGINYFVDNTAKTVTISSTSGVDISTFTYKISTTGQSNPCGVVDSIGTIKSVPIPYITLVSGDINKTYCAEDKFTPIVIQLVNATGYEIASGALPSTLSITSLGSYKYKIDGTTPPDSTGIYKFQILAKGPLANCDGGLLVQITVNPLPQISIAGDDVCSGQTITVVPSTDIASTIQWSVGGVDQDTLAATSSFSYSDTETASDRSFSIKAVGITSKNCKASASTTVKVYANPTKPVIANYAKCEKVGTAEWESLVSGTQGILKWYESMSSTQEIDPGVFDKSDVGTLYYYIEAIDSVNTTLVCKSDRDTVSATVYANPRIVNIDKSDLTNVRVEVQGEAPFTYELSTGISGEFTGYQVTDLGQLTFGTHEVIVYDDNTCKTSATFTIEAIPLEPEKYFTPNGDGINDTWDIGNLELYPNTEIYIHDRFGKEVAKYKGEQFRGWDGSYLGNPLPSTDYWYVIQVRETGKRLVGHFLLKR